MNCSFLFGAGAEYSFNLPTGSEFATRSLLIKNKDMVEAYKKVFKNNNISSEFIFNRKDSVIFRDMVFKTVKGIIDENIVDDEKVLLELKIYVEKKDSSGLIIANRVEDISVSAKNEIKDLYEKYITKENIERTFDKKYKLTTNYDYIFSNLKYEGTIERDFYSLASDENEISDFRYYRIFNYYWSLFFTILKPLLKNTKYESNKDDYIFLFENLQEIISYIYSEEYRKIIIEDKEKSNVKNYYGELINNKNINVKSVFTTNYTPFVEHYFKDYDYHYLSGKLNLFENSKRNIVFEINSNKNIKELCEENEKSLEFFPFIMSQAPIKPIIHPIQILEYSGAINSLKETDYLVIIGYSLCLNDNHVLTLIKYYLNMNENKKVIFCKYKDEKRIINKEVLKRVLKFDNDKQIELIEHDSNANELYEKIEDIVKEKKV